MRAVRIERHGGPDVMAPTDVADPRADAGSVVVDVDVSGVNFIDTYQRSGLYPVAMPYVLGLEGAGAVSEVGDGVDSVQVGDRVAWGTCPGSYAERVAVRADQLVPVPADVPSEVAAALPLQGMTAHFLATDTYPLAPGDRCLIHAGAGGVGLLLIQIAKLRGAEVFTTVGSAAKADLAAAAGADHTILYRDVDFVTAVRDIAGTERPIDVVYDGVGKDTFSASLSVIRMRGTMATFGNASGPVDPIAPLELSAQGSLFLTRPTLFHHISTPDELRRRAADLFSWYADDALDVRIGQRFALDDAADAHRALEGRRTTGKVVLVV